MLYDHTELLPGEKFLGNTARVIFPRPYLSHLKTMRLGNQAFDIHGNKLDNFYGPIFIGSENYEEYNRIMLNRLKEIKNS
jgi:hypothetical protein